MKLVSFSVQKYRSIRSAQKLPVGDLTVLVGPNNEGKSNILRAMVVGMEALTRHGRVVVISRRRTGRYYAAGRRDRFEKDYDWKRDFPVEYQERQPNGNTILDFEFQLSDDELSDFRSEFGSNLNRSLPIRAYFGRDSEPEFKVVKQKVGPKLSDSSARIARFVGRRLRVGYVPSIRTAQAAQRVVDQMVQERLAALEEVDAYKSAVAQIQELQRPVLEKLSTVLRGTLSGFLPEVQTVEVSISSEETYSALRQDSKIVVDDGTATELKHKGDGVQSLAALSLLHNEAKSGPRGSELVLCIEEPEAHLHPLAIHQVRSVLQDIANRQQVVITTHSPVLTNRLDVGSNLIVKSNRVKPASTIAEVRDALGVQTSDNLQSANYALVVEGESDRIALGSLLSHASPLLSTALKNGVIAIETLGGGTNLSYRLDLLTSAMCRYHVFVDKDSTGVTAIHKARDRGLLAEDEYTYASCQGMTESEIEDMYDPQIYRDAVLKSFNVQLKGSPFRSRNGKWSSRATAAFEHDGKMLDDFTKMKLKMMIAEIVTNNPHGALHDARRSAFDALVRTLETAVEGLPNV